MESGISAERENLAMHIAICDDNVGDRKQMERLLNRESDKRAQDTGVFYIDSYGNAKAVMQSPMLYDAFFIDMVFSDTDGATLTNQLLKAGVTAPISLCISSINYKETLVKDPDYNYENIFYLNKPILKKELSDMLDLCIIKKSQQETTIELRGEHDTRYVTEDDILYSKASGNYIHVFLKDGTSIEILSSVDNFYSQLVAYTHYAAISKKAMVNVVHVKKLNLLNVELANGTLLPVSPGFHNNIKTALKNIERAVH